MEMIEKKIMVEVKVMVVMEVIVEGALVGEVIAVEEALVIEEEVLTETEQAAQVIMEEIIGVPQVVEVILVENQTVQIILQTQKILLWDIQEIIQAVRLTIDRREDTNQIDVRTQEVSLAEEVLLERLIVLSETNFKEII